MHHPRLGLPLFAAVLIAASHLAAQDTRSSSVTGPATSAQKNAGRASARGPLPDPALLDGSTQLPEKKSEYGMLGEFEIPGDENSKGDKVGGQQPPPGMPSGGGQADPKGAQGAMPQSGGAAGGQPQAGQEPPKGGAPGGPGGGQNDPNAKAEGIQVAELQTDESAGPAGQVGEPDPNTRKPQPVAIGDPARQIKPAANAPGVIGAQVPAGNTQQMEKATGGTAKGTSGNNGNKGVERGRVMPAGL